MDSPNMHLDSDKVEELIGQLYKNSNIDKINYIKYPCSYSCLIQLSNPNRTIFAKWQEKELNKILFNKEITETFLKGKRTREVSTPMIKFIDLKNGIIIMNYIKGFSFYKMLKLYKPLKREDFINLVELSALAIAEFHNVFRRKYDIDFKLNGFNSNLCLKPFNEYDNNCNLNFKTQLHMDFHLGNIYFNEKSTKVYILDLPGEEYIAKPHYDLASFKSSLLIHTQHPQFKLLNRWCSKSEIFKHFLNTYCSYYDISPNNEDNLLIDQYSSCITKSIMNDIFKYRFKNKSNYFKYIYLKILL